MSNVLDKMPKETVKQLLKSHSKSDLLRISINLSELVNKLSAELESLKEDKES